MGSDPVSNDQRATNTSTSSTRQTSRSSDTERANSDESSTASETADNHCAPPDQIGPDPDYQRATRGENGPVKDFEELRERYSDTWGVIEQDLGAEDLEWGSINEQNFREEFLFGALGGRPEDLGFEGMNARAYTKLMENPTALKKGLSVTLASNFPDKSADAIDKKAQKLVDMAENAYVGEVRQRISQTAIGTLRGAKEPLLAINENSESRRAFLAELARGSGDPEHIASRLQQLGVEPGNASHIGAVCAEAHNQGKIDELASGAVGRDRSYWPGSPGQFASAEQALEESMTSSLDNLDELIDQAETASVEKDSTPGGLSKSGDVLTAPEFKMARQSVFADLGMPGLATGQNTGERGAASEIIAAEIDEAKSKASWRSSVETNVNIGIAVLTAPAGGATAGALSVAGLASSGIQTYNKYRRAESMEVAAEAGVTDAGEARKAETEAHVSAAAGVAGALLGEATDVATSDGTHAAIEMAISAQNEAIKEEAIKPAASALFEQSEKAELQTSIEQRVSASYLQKD